MIEPTVGRIVWYYPAGKAQLEPGRQPCAAVIAHVHNSRLVNLTFFDGAGCTYPAMSVPLAQDETERPDDGHFCEWMPYQKGQATKTEALEKQVAR